MALSKQHLEREIVACEAAIEAHENGAEVQRIVLRAFQEVLENYPDEPTDDDIMSPPEDSI